MTLKEQAVQTAGERLERLETWMRRTCIAMTVTAALVAFLAMIAAYCAYDYVCLKNALAEISTKAASDLKQLQNGFPAPKHATALHPRRIL